MRQVRDRRTYLAVAAVLVSPTDLRLDVMARSMLVSFREVFAVPSSVAELPGSLRRLTGISVISVVSSLYLSLRTHKLTSDTHWKKPW